MNGIFTMYDMFNTSTNCNIIFDITNNSSLILPFSTYIFSINYSLLIKSLIFLYIITLISSCSLFQSIDTITQTMSEDDLSSVQDLFIMVMFTSSIFISYMTFFTGFFFFKGIQIIVAISFIYLISLILGTLFGVMFNLRYYALIFLNGSGKSRKITYNYLLDVISCIAFNMRICVQLIRIVLLLITYQLCSNLYNEVLFNFEVSGFLLQDFKISNYFILYIRILIELAHVYIIFTMQFASFFFMVF